jgi:hypothetical protein
MKVLFSFFNIPETPKHSQTTILTFPGTREKRIRERRRRSLGREGRGDRWAVAGLRYADPGGGGDGVG